MTSHRILVKAVLTYIVLDEEDDIQKQVGEQRAYKHRKRWTQGGAKDGVKYERTIKTGRSRQQETLGFPNYFLAQKVRAKVAQADETRGNKIFIKSDLVHDNDKSTRVPKSTKKNYVGRRKGRQ